MTVIVPFAKYEPLSFLANLGPRESRKAALLHTNGGGANLGPFFDTRYAQTRQRIGAHLQVMKDGSLIQYVPLDLCIYHAFSASLFTVGIETEDDGYPSTPWTDPQIATIVKTLNWMQVPARAIANPSGDDGLGWHDEFPVWNYDGHVCPGSVREAQIRADILPQLAKSYQAPEPYMPKPWPGVYLRLTNPFMRSQTVRYWQFALHRIFNIPWSAQFGDGIFGPHTEELTKQFQGSHSLATDGIVGPVTWRAGMQTAHL